MTLSRTITCCYCCLDPTFKTMFTYSRSIALIMTHTEPILRFSLDAILICLFTRNLQTDEEFRLVHTRLNHYKIASPCEILCKRAPNI